MARRWTIKMPKRLLRSAPHQTANIAKNLTIVAGARAPIPKLAVNSAEPPHWAPSVFLGFERKNHAAREWGAGGRSKVKTRGGVDVSRGSSRYLEAVRSQQVVGPIPGLVSPPVSPDGSATANAA